MSHSHASEANGGGCCGSGCGGSGGHGGEDHGGHGHGVDGAAIIVTGVVLGTGLLLEWIWKLDQLAYYFYVVAFIALGLPIFRQAWRALRKGRLDMNVLMTIAVIGAVIIREYSEAAVVVFLFALSEWLEGMSMSRAKRAVAELMELAPEIATVRAEDGILELPASAVKVGEIVLIRSGARVPLDGVVQSGHSSIDQSPITGESIPVSKSPGDEVFAGTINGEGSLEVEVTRPASGSTLARMIRLVEEAQSSRAPSQRFIDRFARVYTPSVVVLAFLLAVVPPLFSGNWSEWFYRALVLLVIACPCALVIATPISIVSGLTALARRGVLVKGGAALEAVGKLRALAVDKTGTITRGQPEVTAVHPLGECSESELLAIAAAIDSHSTHPLAQAVVAAADRAGVPWSRAANYRSIGGRGAEADVDGHPCFVGNHRFTHDAGVCTPEVEALFAEIEAGASSVVVVGHRPHQGPDGEPCAGRVLGVLAVRDTLRPEVSQALAALHRLGIRPIVMLSGDNQRTVSAISSEAGIDEAHGDLLPEQKIEALHRLQQERGAVGMVGDGVNDAPALAAATVGIAMGQGTDAALETADIALLNNDLQKVAEAIHVGRQTLRMIKGNIAFALGIKFLFLLLAALGYTSLWMAILADTGATLVVIANALTLLRTRTAPPPAAPTV